MWHRLVWYKSIYISENEHPLKCRHTSIKLHDVTRQKTGTFTVKAREFQVSDFTQFIDFSGTINIKNTSIFLVDTTVLHKETGSEE
jgi:hypothetical protein